MADTKKKIWIDAYITAMRRMELNFTGEVDEHAKASALYCAEYADAAVNEFERRERSGKLDDD